MVDYREDAHWSVYIHIVPKSLSGYEYDKYYVGITSRPVEERWGNEGKHYINNIKDTAIKKAILKYGWDKMEHEVIATNITEDEAKAMEISLIKLLDAFGEHGYNLTRGGDFSYDHINKRCYQFTTDGTFIKEYYTAVDAAKDNNYRYDALKKALNEKRQYGNYIFARSKDVVRNEKTYLLKDLSSWHLIVDYSIYVFELNGVFINKFNSVNEASEKMKVDRNSITYSANKNKITTRSKYVFKYGKDIDIINGVPTLKESPIEYIYVFDINGAYITRCNSIKEAAELTNMTSVNITMYLNNRDRRPRTKGYLFRLEKDVEYINGICVMKDFKQKKSIPIYQFDVHRNFIKKYNSIEEASIASNISEKRIKRYANTKKQIKNSMGYNWRYEDSVDRINDNEYKMII